MALLRELPAPPPRLKAWRASWRRRALLPLSSIAAESMFASLGNSWLVHVAVAFCHKIACLPNECREGTLCSVGDPPDMNKRGETMTSKIAFPPKTLVVAAATILGGLLLTAPVAAIDK